MNWANIGVVYRKELTDTLRDKRTLIATILVPLIFFPLITLGFGSAASHSVRKIQQEKLSVMVLGAEHAPDLMSAMRTNASFQIEEPASNYLERISDKKLRVAVEIPPDFQALVDSGKSNVPPVRILHYTGEMRSQMAKGAVRGVLSEQSARLIRKRLAEAGLAPAILNPFPIEEKNVAPPEKVAGNLLGGLIPYMIIFLSFVGAMGPAIDLTAGEKERGTIETILASPVRRTHLVIGKFLMVLTASVITTLISLASFAVTFGLPIFFMRQLVAAGKAGFHLSATNVTAVFILMLPLAIMFSAGLLALSLIARNYKEAQSYLSPVMMIVIIPAMAGILPGVDPGPLTSIIPILNVSLIAKDVLGGHFDWNLILLVFSSTCLYAGAALALAVATFKRESVLFRT